MLKMLYLNGCLEKGDSPMLYRSAIVLLMLLLAACGSDSTSGASDNESQKISEKNFMLLMSPDSIKALLGSDRFKLVFRDGDVGNLVLLEHMDGSLKMTALAEGYNVYHPTFSPDGGKIAFSSAYEGAPFESRLYIIDLKYPERIDSLDVESAAIPRWYVLPDGDTIITYVDYNGDDKGEQWLSSATWRVSYKEHKFKLSGSLGITYKLNTFETPEKIFDRSYNGGVAYDFSFAATGATRLYFHRAEDDEDVFEDRYGDQQVCNVSVSRDSSKLISFLETAGKMGREFTHDESGAWHHFIFYQDESGEIVNAIETLPNTAFDHVEWLYGIPMQVGILSSMETEYYDVVLIDYMQSKVHKFIKSDSVSMWHPDLWIDR